MTSFCHLHLHSSFSPGWGVHSVETLCARAGDLGMTRLALTDRNGLYGIPHFLEAARAAGLQPIIGAEAVTASHRALLLCRDEIGYANLCRLLSDLHCRGDFSLPEALQRFREGLVILSDDARLLQPLRRQCPENLFVELSPGHDMHGALALGRKLKLPPAATCRAVLLDESDLEQHRVLRAIAENRKLSRLDEVDTAKRWDSLLPPEKLADFFPHCPEALENAGAIAASCKTDWDFSATVFPSFRGMGAAEASAELQKKAEEGALWRYGRIDEKIEKRLAKELTIIGEKGFAHYFLVVEELAAQSPRTCGRGSAAASLVAYCLGITHVDPVRHNLFFERFLNPGRLDPPDIDIDFPWDERDAILDYAFARYGSRRAAMVANQVGFGERGALREVAKVYGLPESEIKDLADGDEGRAPKEEWRRIREIASRLGGQLRHLSLHCGGLVVVPDEIRRYVPVEVSAKGLPVIQWEKDQAEAAGLVKIDILGNRSLAVIRDALTAIEANCGRKIDYARWQPLEDERACELIRAGKTMGCFYVESPATRQLLKKMWHSPKAESCDIFEHMVMASSIIRPASNRFMREFVERMHGRPWRSLHPLLDEVLGETYGIAIYQEQITQMAMALADFSAFDGDQLRKIISKKHKAKKLEDYRLMFFEGGTEGGVAEDTLFAVWEQILSFAGYSFCKPHSASYALVSCKSAWLKANYPAEFMAAVISNRGGYYSPLTYLSECRRMDVKVLPPEINESEEPYLGRQREVRVGLMQVQGLSRRGLESLLAERKKGGDFLSFGDFLRRTHIDPADVRLLVKAGCFDALEGLRRRPALLWELLGFDRRFSGGGSGLLFDRPEEELPEPPPYDEATVLRQEIETLGMLVSCHPMTLYRSAFKEAGAVPAASMHRWVGRYVTLAGWWVTGKTVQTRAGAPMEFISFEDTSATFDTTFFPRAYARFCRKLSRSRPYLLKGKIEEEQGVVTLNVEWVGFLDEI